MAKDQYLERLKAVPLFASLSKKELGLLLHQADHLRYPARYRVVREGANGEEFWVVIEGELSVLRNDREVARLGPGDFFGELAVIDPAPRDATIVSKTPVELLVVGRRRFWSVVEDVPALSRKLLVTLARRVRSYDEAAGKAAPAGRARR